MDTPGNERAGSAWKGRLIKFLVYVVIGFLCAFLYRQMKD